MNYAINTKKTKTQKWSRTCVCVDKHLFGIFRIFAPCSPMNCQTSILGCSLDTWILQKLVCDPDIEFFRPMGWAQLRDDENGKKNNI